MKATIVVRAVRDFKIIIQDYLHSSYTAHESNLNRFFSCIAENEIINKIVSPYLNMNVSLENIFMGNNPYRIQKLNLPSDTDTRIAIILRLMRDELNQQVKFEILGTQMNPRVKRLDDALEIFNNQVIAPSLRDLINKLDDFIEDEVEDKTEVPEAALNIFVEHISATHGANIAIGQKITQTTNYQGVAEKIVQQAQNDNAIDPAQLASLQEVAQEIEDELQADQPDEEKLGSFAQRIYNIGKNGLLKITKNVINDPKWNDIIMNLLLS